MPMRTMAAPLLLLVLLATTSVVAGEPSCAAGESECKDPSSSSSCSLFMAPSSIPGAGLGLFTSRHLPRGSSVAPQDLFVALEDEYKTLPYRGHQRFLSWLGYIWPAHTDALYHSYDEGSFPPVPGAHYPNSGLSSAASELEFYDEEGERVNAWAPGVASLVNSHLELQNIEQEEEEEEEGETGTDGNSVSFRAIKDIPAGSELFLYYGDEWHERYEDEDQYHTLEKKYKLLDGKDLEFERLENYMERLKHQDLPTEAQKRQSLLAQLEPNPSKIRRLQELLDEETDPEEIEILEAQLQWQEDKVEKWKQVAEKVDEEEMLDPDSIAFIVENRNEDEDEDDDDDGEDEDDDEEDDDITEEDSIKSLEWLQQHGACVDRNRPGESAADGMGAFANHFIPSGSVISPAPLLTLKRDDLVMYEADENADNFRDVLNLDAVKGHELLLNYCFGHPESELLLLPYAPVVNFINHDGTKPNAEIRWPDPSRSLLGDPSNWLNMHPVNVLEQSSKLMMEFVALRDIQPGEEIFIDYGKEWEAAWNKHVADVEHESDDDSDEGLEFRHEIGVPAGFFPENWIHQLVEYELSPMDAQLKPGEFEELTWAHNGKPIAKGAYRVGLPSGFSERLREFSDDMGITDVYKKLLHHDILDSDEWFVFDDPHGEQWFAQRYKSTDWNFNIHYVAAWDEAAEQRLFRLLGSAGFDVVLEGIANKLNLDNVTCIHTPFMGITECDQSFMHTDVYATDEKAFNLIFPLIVVNGSKPELDIQSDDANIVVSVNYQYDVAVAMGDWGYHKTSPISYDESGEMRIVLGMYCGQVDDSNAKMMKYIYNGEDPAPFMSRFDHPNWQVHWSHDGVRLPK